jgi:hypothetical protein
LFMQLISLKIGMPPNGRGLPAADDVEFCTTGNLKSCAHVVNA